MAHVPEVTLSKSLNDSHRVKCSCFIVCLFSENSLPRLNQLNSPFYVYTILYFGDMSISKVLFLSTKTWFLKQVRFRLS